MINFRAMFLAAFALLGLGNAAYAETRVTYKSAKTTSSYYQMGVQIAEPTSGGTSSTGAAGPELHALIRTTVRASTTTRFT